jgi:hypothetical protein
MLYGSMIHEGEVRMAKRLDGNDVHFDAESLSPTILAGDDIVPRHKRVI